MDNIGNISNICGFVNLYKEQDFTSNDAVNVVRGIFGRIKTGHTGTLDPMATGVLPICLGRATKLADFVQAEKKVYRTALKLGLTTDTYDVWGEVLSECEVKLKAEDIKEAILSFVGEQEQIPPMYSAVKVKGKRLYELAREGKTAERKARSIIIYDIYDIVFEEGLVYFTVCCSKGTYIRTLCYDIGEKLGVGGAMAALERLSAGNFSKENSITIGELKRLKEEGRLLEAVLPVESVLTEFGYFKADRRADKYLKNGNKVSMYFIEGEKPRNESRFLLFDREGRLAGIFERKGDFAKPVCMLY